jgi:hypothetical protein
LYHGAPLPVQEPAAASAAGETARASLGRPAVAAWLISVDRVSGLLLATDFFADACDNCLGQPNTDQENNDLVTAGNAADAVGDVCDPRPTRSNDLLLRFEPFTGPLSVEWATRRGSWSVIGDELVPEATPSVLGFVPFDMTGEFWTIDAVFSIRRVNATATDIWVGGEGPGLEGWITCAMRMSTNTSTILFYEIGAATSVLRTFGMPQNLAEPLVVGSVVRGRISFDGDEAFCSGTGVRTTDEIFSETPSVMVKSSVAAVSSITIHLSR